MFYFLKSLFIFSFSPFLHRHLIFNYSFIVYSFTCLSVSESPDGCTCWVRDNLKRSVLSFHCVFHEHASSCLQHMPLPTELSHQPGANIFKYNITFVNILFFFSGSCLKILLFFNILFFIF